MPLLLNPAAGTAGELERAVAASGLPFDLIPTAPAQIRATVADLVRTGTRRVAVAGGDGTIASVAAVLAGTPVELAPLPAGTLNHFVRGLGIPADLGEALVVAAGQSVRAADAAYVNDRLFLNTSSAGMYVAFVRVRDHLERRLGYWLASLIAALGLLTRFQRFTVELEIDGVARQYLTPLIFVGIGERELKLPTLGGRIERGRRGLHVLVVRGRTAARLAALALAAAARGVRRAARTPHLDSFLVTSVAVSLPRTTVSIACDGEIVRMTSPLRYRFAPGALRVVAPPSAPS